MLLECQLHAALVADALAHGRLCEAGRQVGHTHALTEQVNGAVNRSIRTSSFVAGLCVVQQDFAITDVFPGLSGRLVGIADRALAINEFVNIITRLRGIPVFVTVLAILPAGHECLHFALAVSSAII
ncbi:hypothetical protein D3C86_1625010 [compost metagenome]